MEVAGLLNGADTGPVAVIADDLTGAADTAVQMVPGAGRVMVLFDIDARSLSRAGGQGACQPVAVDTESRNLSRERAYSRTAEAAHLLRRAGYRFIYKKIDSTLRGNLGAEIDAVMDVFSFPLAIVAPAFPSQGRTTSGGVQLVHGTRLNNSDAHIPSLLGRQSRRPVLVMDVADLRRGPHHLADLVLRQLGRAGLIVADAQTENDLARVASLGQAFPGPLLWVGSAGLARVMFRGGAGSHAFQPPPGLPACRAACRPVLVVAGSTSQVTGEQVAVLGDQGAVVVRLNPGAPTEIAFAEAKGQEALNLGRDVVITTGESQGLGEGNVATLIAETLGRLSSRLACGAALGGLVMTGGDTAVRVCRALGAAAIWVEREIEAGIPAGRLEGGACHGLLVVTKAGAFGGPGALLAAVSYLRGRIEHGQ